MRSNGVGRKESEKVLVSRFCGGDRRKGKGEHDGQEENGSGLNIRRLLADDREAPPRYRLKMVAMSRMKAKCVAGTYEASRRR